MKRILIIADERKLAEVVQSYLLREGYETAVASDGSTGLHLGADDYVTKPFSPKELVARVEAVLRRTSQEDLLTDEFWLSDTIVLDNRAKEIRRNGEKVAVTPTEFKLLHTFAQHPRRSFTRAELIEKAFGFDFAGEERVIDTHIKNLRRKIEDDPKDPRIVVSVYGVGYRLGDL